MTVFACFPHRHGHATRRPGYRDETCWKFKRGVLCESFLPFSHFAASKPTFATSFLMNPKIYDLKINVSCRASVKFHDIHVAKCHTCHGICTMSPLHSTLTMRFAKNMQHDTSEVPRLPREISTEVPKLLMF